MTTERLKYIFGTIADREVYNEHYAHPWIDDELIYCTDGHMLLCLANEDGRDLAVTVNNPEHPMNARKILELPLPSHDEDYYITLDEMRKAKDKCRIHGVVLPDKRAKKVARVLSLFGLDAGLFYVDNNRLVFPIHNHGITGALMVLGIQVREPDVTEPLECTCTNEMTKFPGAWWDDDKGEENLAKYLEEDRIAEEEYNKKNFDVYEMIVVKHAFVNVRAHDLKEARAIAERHMYRLSYGDPEVEGYIMTCAFDARKNSEEYYDATGRHKFEKE